MITHVAKNSVCQKKNVFLKKVLQIGSNKQQVYQIFAIETGVNVD